jgi:hypothetical protein
LGRGRYRNAGRDPPGGTGTDLRWYLLNNPGKC